MFSTQDASGHLYSPKSQVSTVGQLKKFGAHSPPGQMYMLFSSQLPGTLFSTWSIRWVTGPVSLQTERQLLSRQRARLSPQVFCLGQSSRESLQEPSAHWKKVISCLVPLENSRYLVSQVSSYGHSKAVSTQVLSGQITYPALGQVILVGHSFGSNAQV